jgi:hypothetical protein
MGAPGKLLNVGRIFHQGFVKKDEQAYSGYAHHAAADQSAPDADSESAGNLAGSIRSDQCAQGGEKDGSQGTPPCYCIDSWVNVAEISENGRAAQISQNNPTHPHPANQKAKADTQILFHAVVSTAPPRSLRKSRAESTMIDRGNAACGNSFSMGLLVVDCEHVRNQD